MVQEICYVDRKHMGSIRDVFSSVWSLFVWSLFNADWTQFNKDMAENFHFPQKVAPGETVAAAVDTEGHQQEHI